MYRLNLRDNRINDFNKSTFDCFLFDAFTVLDIKKILSGKSMSLNNFLLTEKISKLSIKNKYPERRILSKVHLINSIIENDPYARAFLVFQTISWKMKKIKMPYILIPVRIYEGEKIVKDGEAFINPAIKKYLDDDVNIEVNSRNIQEIDNKQLAKVISDANGRIIYEMYLTYFKVEFEKQRIKNTKKFTVNEYDSYIDLDNHNVLPIDFELKNLFLNVLNGDNTLVETSYGTRKVALIINLFAEYIAAKKRVLYVSEKSYQSLNNKLDEVNLTSHIDDLLHNTSIDCEVTDVDYDKNLLREAIVSLRKYEKRFEAKYNGFSFISVLKEIVQLKDLDRTDLDIEFSDELDFKDVLIIKNTLIKLESILNQSKIGNFADSIYNDLDVKETLDDEERFIDYINLVIEDLETLNKLRKELNDTTGIYLSDNIYDLEDSLSNLDFLDIKQYPESWFLDYENFRKARKRIDVVNSLAGRTQSLFTTIKLTYDTNILKYEIDEAHKALRDNISNLGTDDINLVLGSIDKIKNDQQVILELIDRFKKYYQELSELLGIEFLDDIFNFIKRYIAIINAKHFDKQWLEIDNTKKVLKLLEDSQKEVVDYFNFQDQVMVYFSQEVLDTNQSIFKDYLANISGRNIPKEEVLQSFKKVRRYTHESFANLSKKSRIKAIQKLLDLYQVRKSYLKAEKKLSNVIALKNIRDIKVIKEDFNRVISFVNEYKGKEISELLLRKVDKNKINLLYSQMQFDIHQFRQVTNDGFYQQAVSSNLVKLEENFKEMFYDINIMFKYESDLRRLTLNPPSSFVLDDFKTASNLVYNYKNTKARLDDIADENSMLYGEKYAGEDTVFKPIRLAIINFRRFAKLFPMNDELTQLYLNKKSGELLEYIYQVTGILGNIRRNIDLLSNYYNSDIDCKTIDQHLKYLNKFTNIEELIMWESYLENNHNLRMYGQLRIAAQINNGEIKKNLSTSFMYSFYKALLEREMPHQDNENIIRLMHSFNDLINKRFMKNRMELHERKLVKPRIVLTNLSSIDKIKKDNFDLVIVDNAQLIHKNYYPKVISMGKQYLIIKDNSNKKIKGNMFNLFRTMPRYEIENNYRLSLYLPEDNSGGVIFKQNALKFSDLNIGDDITSKLKQGASKINVVCLNGYYRRFYFNMIVDRILKDDELNADFYHYIKNINVIKYENYMPSADVIYYMIEDDFEHVISTMVNVLRNGREIIVVDKNNILENDKYASINSVFTKDDIEFYPEVTDPICLKLIESLETDLIFRQGVSPYDLVMFDSKEIKLHIKITFNKKKYNDILEESHMMFDSEYEDTQKYIISLDDLFYTWDDIVNQLKDVIKNVKG